MLIIIFFPTILLLLTIPLWYCKKVSNEALEIIAYCCMVLSRYIWSCEGKYI